MRALRGRVEKTPLALAVRGRFLVGARPVPDELIRRFVRSAAASGIDVFRLSDPLNDVDNLRVAADAIREAGCQFDAGLIYGSQQHDALIAAARAEQLIGSLAVRLDGLPIPPAAAQAPAEAWLVAATPLPPSTSGQTSRPLYTIGFRPLNTEKSNLAGNKSGRLYKMNAAKRRKCNVY